MYAQAHTVAGEPQQTPDHSYPITSPDVGTPQENNNWLEPGADPDNRLISPFLRHLVSDQKQFWSAPAHFQIKDLKWIVPFAGVTTAFIASDSWWSKQVPAGHVASSKKISDYGTYSLIALGGASFLFGQVTHDEHASETGLLAGEAAIDATGVTYAFKELTQRQRPFQGNGNGSFFQGGGSFPSEHSAIAWSIASTWAHEYPGWLSQIAAYGLASTVTMTRVTAKQHFPSDVIIGSALGWYFGRQVYRSHHDPELGGTGWASFTDQNAGDRSRNPNYMASPYVPLDSWIYPALERLIALGYIRSAVLGMRPWTRMECARLLQEAQDSSPEQVSSNADAEKLFMTLMGEFHPELERLDGSANLGARVDSIYARSMGISGTPLRDGYHFGQTINDDYGRPYWSGYNNVTGIIADAQTGPVSFYVRGEYQHAPTMPSYSPQALAAVAAADLRPPLANGTAVVNQLDLLDSAVSININNVQISVGKQSAWLGPGDFSSFLMSNNAAPIPMVKIDDVAAHEIPGLSRILGPMRAQFFIAQLSGQQWEFCAASECQSYPGYPNVVGPAISPQPFIHGEKISFQPTPNLEFGMGVTAMFGGPGLPVTFGNFFRTYYAHSSTAVNNPGKRISQADLSYRVPGLRNWLTFYLDSLVTDEVSPIGSTRANVSPGIFLARVPKLPKLQFRAEGYNESRTTEFSPGFVYADNRRFLDGYTNEGQLLGSWIGRAGRGLQALATYSLSARSHIEVGYRLQDVPPRFIGGGRLADYMTNAEFMLGHQFSLSGFVQYEQWKFPVLSSTPQSDVTVAAQLTFYPHWQLH